MALLALALVLGLYGTGTRAICNGHMAVHICAMAWPTAAPILAQLPYISAWAQRTDQCAWRSVPSSASRSTPISVLSKRTVLTLLGAAKRTHQSV